MVSQLETRIVQAHGDEKKVAGVLRDAGKVLDNELAATLNKIFLGFIGSSSKWNFSIAETLSWSDYAIPSPDYYSVLMDYLQGNVEESSVRWQDFAGRFGSDKLREVARRFLALQEYVPTGLVDGTASAADLYNFQQKGMNKSLDLAKKGMLHGFGPWLFCGPYKIFSLLQRNLWGESRLQDVYMPLGSRVVRGLNLLSKNKVSNIDASLLRPEEPGLSDSGFGTVFMAHSFQKRLADLSGSLVLHINSGLHVLGGGAACVQ